MFEKARFEDVRLGGPGLDSHRQGIGSPAKEGVRVTVLDTWDGFKEIGDERERLKAEKMLISLADGSNFGIIFVSEEPNKTTMDYLVDGIIELDRFEEQSRILREIEMQKLRDSHRTAQVSLHAVRRMFRHFIPYASPDYSTA